jgi:hypothetical protein
MSKQQRVSLAFLCMAVALIPFVASASPAGAAAAAAAPGCGFSPPFERNDFTRSTIINNKWLPLVPGMQFTLEGRANRGGGPLPHTVVLTVTDVTKVIDGVRTVVLWDVDVQSGVLAEAELAFHAQDDDGNVWGLGEYPEEYENGKFIGAPKTWISGEANARGGFALIGNPRLGSPRYLQAVAPAIDFLDCAQVFAKNQHICVPAGCYDDVLITDETSPLASGRAHQRKYYAPGVGNVQISAVDDPEGETLVLIKAQHLGAHALAHARQEALRLDRRAYRFSEVYRHTAPAEHTPR